MQLRSVSGQHEDIGENDNPRKKQRTWQKARQNASAQTTAYKLLQSEINQKRFSNTTTKKQGPQTRLVRSLSRSGRVSVFGGLSPFWCRQMQIEKLEMQQEKAVTPEILNEVLRGSDAIRDVAVKVLSILTLLCR